VREQPEAYCLFDTRVATDGIKKGSRCYINVRFRPEADICLLPGRTLFRPTSKAFVIDR